MNRPFTMGLIALALTSCAVAQPVEKETTGPATQPAAASDYALTIYSTADPATFDPLDLERQRR